MFCARHGPWKRRRGLYAVGGVRKRPHRPRRPKRSAEKPKLRAGFRYAGHNETGVLQDIKSIAALARETETISHTDAAQAAGKIAVNFADLGVDAMTVSAHKAGGPKGVAALVVRRGVDWTPLMDGGGHENGRRSGTENVAGIVGMGAAFELSAKRQAAVAVRLKELRDNMENALRQIGRSFLPPTPRDCPIPRFLA